MLARSVILTVTAATAFALTGRSLRPVALSHGTLIVAVLSKDGLVVTSDRRRLLPDGTHVDNIRKVRAIGQNAVFGASGVTLLAIPGTTLDVPAVVTRYFAGAQLVDPPEIIASLLDYLRTDVQRFFRNVSVDHWKRSASSVKGPLFRIVVFAAADGIYSSIDISCSVATDSAGVTPTCTAALADPFTKRLLTVGGSGTDVILSHVLTPGTRDWPEVRADPVLRRILFSKGSIRESLSMQDAAYFGRTLIRLLSEHKRSMGYEDDVSATSDCVVLRPEGTVESPCSF